MNATIAALLMKMEVWAARRPEVIAVALVGSYAAGTEQPDSDVDLIVLTRDPHRQLGDRDWLDEFGVTRSIAVERWGMVTSLRVGYEEGTEVELGIALPRWAWADPVDEGTAAVVRSGMRPLYDPDEVLERLIIAVASSQ